MQPNPYSPLAFVEGRQDWRVMLEQQYQTVAQRLQASYTRVLPTIQAEIDRYAGAIDALGRESLTAQELRELAQFQNLMRRVRAEMDGFARIAGASGTTLREGAIQLALDDARRAALGQAGAGAQLVAGAWMNPNPEALNNLLGLIDDEHLRAGLANFGDNAAQNFADVMLALTAQGQNPRTIAQRMSEWLAIPYSWAENQTRTLQMWSYRLANHAAYRANSAVVEGWMWRSALDVRTCMSCIAQHGTRYTVDEVLNDHHRGRCAPIPIIIGSRWVDEVESGGDWFARQPEGVQRQMMGGQMWELWRRGRFDLRELSVPYVDGTYGQMLRAATVQELTGAVSRAGRGQVITLDGVMPRDDGTPGNTLDSLNRFVEASNGPLAAALVGAPADPVRLLRFGDDARWVIDVDGVRAMARDFVQQSLDIQYGREYLVSMAQQRALENGVSVPLTRAEALMNQQYATQARAILDAARIGNVTLTEAQTRRLQNSINGGYLNMVYSREGSERGSLQNAAARRRGGNVARTAEERAIQRERRNEFLRNVRGIDDI